MFLFYIPVSAAETDAANPSGSDIFFLPNIFYQVFFEKNSYTSTWLLPFSHCSFNFFVHNSFFMHLIVLLWEESFTQAFYKWNSKLLVDIPKKTCTLFFITFFNLINFEFLTFKFASLYNFRSQNLHTCQRTPQNLPSLSWKYLFTSVAIVLQFSWIYRNLKNIQFDAHFLYTIFFLV